MANDLGFMAKSHPLIGIYGGTFDPIHFGHLNLAIQIMEMHKLDEVWFCPVAISPHKLKDPPTPAQHRLEMVRLALLNIPRCYAIDIEVTREGPSYTIDTLRLLHEQYPDKQFCLILGDDAAPNFIHWHQPEEIIKSTPIFIGRRSPSPLNLEALTGSPAVHAALLRGVTHTKVFDISSTEIRKRIAAGLYCGHLVPAKVLDYIYGHHLYYVR